MPSLKRKLADSEAQQGDLIRALNVERSEKAQYAARIHDLLDWKETLVGEGRDLRHENEAHVAQIRKLEKALELAMKQLDDSTNANGVLVRKIEECELQRVAPRAVPWWVKWIWSK